MISIPKSLKIAILLVFVYLLTELLRCYLYYRETEVFGESLTQTFLIIVFLTNLFFVYNISLRQNWARIGLIVFYLIDILSCFHHIADEFDFVLTIGIVSVIKKILQLSIIIILLSKTSRKWFSLKEDNNMDY